MTEKNIDCNKVLEEFLKAKVSDYTTKDGSKYKTHTCTVAMKNKSELQIKIRTTANGDAKIWAYPVTGVPDRRRVEVLETLNGRMRSYRFVAFYLDGDNDVVADHDFGLYGSVEDVAKCLNETFNLFVDIVDKCLPDIFQAVWQDKPEGEDEILRMNPFGNEEE